MRWNGQTEDDRGRTEGAMVEGMMDLVLVVAVGSRTEEEDDALLIRGMHPAEDQPGRDMLEGERIGTGIRRLRPRQYRGTIRGRTLGIRERVVVRAVVVVVVAAGPAAVVAVGGAVVDSRDKTPDVEGTSHRPCAASARCRTHTHAASLGGGTNLHARLYSVRDDAEVWRMDARDTMVQRDERGDETRDGRRWTRPSRAGSKTTKRAHIIE